KTPAGMMGRSGTLAACCRPPRRSARIISCAGLDGCLPRHLSCQDPAMLRAKLRYLSFLLGLVQSLHGGLLRGDDARSADPPKGELTQQSFDKSKIFPGTVRDYWIYVPRQYDPEKPACLYVCQDGVQYKAPAVFDELIDKKEMPITIGVFIAPGRVKAP